MEAHLETNTQVLGEKLDIIVGRYLVEISKLKKMHLWVADDLI